MTWIIAWLWLASSIAAGVAAGRLIAARIERAIARRRRPEALSSTFIGPLGGRQ